MVRKGGQTWFWFLDFTLLCSMSSFSNPKYDITDIHLFSFWWVQDSHVHLRRVHPCLRLSSFLIPSQLSNYLPAVVVVVAVLDWTSYHGSSSSDTWQWSCGDPIRRGANSARRRKRFSLNRNSIGVTITIQNKATWYDFLPCMIPKSDLRLLCT